ncbi:hypothetical protein Leryth_023063 [Lithospermum erythrorhizon]|nr:hypothetical protein Leryth_023063 [Lithospermum erythrorhizon]
MANILLVLNISSLLPGKRVCAPSILKVGFSRVVQNFSTIKVTDNPADELVALLNSNRTAHKSSALYSNPGLACIALQYIKAYQGDCGAVGGSDAKKPPDSQFAETFAPNCGVQVSSLSSITGRFLACQSKYPEPAEAFNHILIQDIKSLDILYSKNHTEVGAAVSGSDGGGPYFCATHHYRAQSWQGGAEAYEEEDHGGGDFIGMDFTKRKETSLGVEDKVQKLWIRRSIWLL